MRFSSKNSTTQNYFVDLDSFIDLQALQKINTILEEKLFQFREQNTRFFTAGQRLDPNKPKQSGTKTIYLRAPNKKNFSYLNIANPAENHNTPEADEFPEVLEFMKMLPLKSIGRAFIIFDFDGIDEPVHRDHDIVDLVQEFIWIRPNENKQFYIYDRHTKQEHYVNSYSAWFNTRHFHGVRGRRGLAVSLRVDGTFNDELREHIANQSLAPPSRYSFHEKVYRRIKAGLSKTLVRLQMKTS